MPASFDPTDSVSLVYSVARLRAAAIPWKSIADHLGVDVEMIRNLQWRQPKLWRRCFRLCADEFTADALRACVMWLSERIRDGDTRTGQRANIKLLTKLLALEESYGFLGGEHDRLTSLNPPDSSSEPEALQAVPLADRGMTGATTDPSPFFESPQDVDSVDESATTGQVGLPAPVKPAETPPPAEGDAPCPH